MMEAFADFGTVEYMGVTTFAGIFAWFGMNEPVVAAQLSALVCFVLFILFLEQWSRRKQRFFSRASVNLLLSDSPLDLNDTCCAPVSSHFLLLHLFYP